MVYYLIARALRGVCGALFLFSSLFAPLLSFKDPGPVGQDRIRTFIATYQPKHASRYAEVIEWHSNKYRHSQDLIAAVLWVETRYKFWLTSSAGCVGPGGVSPLHWGFVCFMEEFDNGHLAAYLKLKGIKNPTRYMRRIGYGTELTCWILRYLMDTYDLDINRALVVYAYKDGLKKARACSTPFQYEYVRLVSKARYMIRTVKNDQCRAVF